MTQRTVVECDGICNPTEVETGSDNKLPENWSKYVRPDGENFHLCPFCSSYVGEFINYDKSVGDILTVEHNYIGEEFLESVHISSPVDKEDSGTHSMSVRKLIDEPPSQYPNYDVEKDEGWHFHVHDHLGLSIIGNHKDNPRVILEPEEFSTSFEIREENSGYSFDEIAVEKSIDVRWIED